MEAIIAVCIGLFLIVLLLISEVIKEKHTLFATILRAVTLVVTVLMLSGMIIMMLTVIFTEGFG